MIINQEKIGSSKYVANISEKEQTDLFRKALTVI